MVTFSSAGSHFWTGGHIVSNMLYKDSKTDHVFSWSVFSGTFILALTFGIKIILNATKIVNKNFFILTYFLEMNTRPAKPRIITLNTIAITAPSDILLLSLE